MDRARPSHFGAIVVALALSSGCQEPPVPEPSGAAPRLMHHVAHGSFFGADGQVVEPTLTNIEHTQLDLIRQLEHDAGALDAELIFATVHDEVVARSIYLDELIDAAHPPDGARLVQLNAAMRDHYLITIRGEAPGSLRRAGHRGIDDATEALLAAGGIEARTIIGSSGAEYVADCREAGVPVPDEVFDESSGWVNRDSSTTRSCPTATEWRMRSGAGRAAIRRASASLFLVGIQGMSFGRTSSG